MKKGYDGKDYIKISLRDWPHQALPGINQTPETHPVSQLWCHTGTKVHNIAFQGIMWTCSFLFHPIVLTLSQALILSHLEYHTHLLTGLLASMLAFLPSIIHRAAKLMFGKHTSKTVVPCHLQCQVQTLS